MTDATSTYSDTPSGLGTAEPRDYFALMKPRVMSLVVFTAWVGLFVAPGQLSWPLAAASILCIAVGAGASGALNMWWEAETDAMMSRTKTRPIPAGKLSRDSALGFGVIMSALSVLGLAMASNYFAAAFLAFTIAFYAVFYTMWLKRATPQNIVIGGAAGAFPPMVGYAAVTGSITWDSVILFLITFMWTPPHFWALALYKSIDYDKAGIPMMPNVAGAKSTRRQIFIYALVLAGVCVLPLVTGLGGPLYGVIALLLNVGFVGLAYRVWQSRAGDRPEQDDERSLYDVKAGDKAARNLFAFSLFYLFIIFVAIAAEHALKLVG